MIHRTALLASLALGLCLLPAVADNYDTGAVPVPFGCQPPDLAIYKVPWSSPTITSGAFARTIVGNFDSYSGPDLVVRRGNSASLQPNVATEENNIDLPVNVTDMACLPGLGQYGGDGIAVVNGSGLRLISYNPVTHGFANTLISSSWAGVRQVVAADVDGDGLCDLLGLSSDYLSVLRLQQVSTGVFAPATAFTLGGTAIRVVRTIEWDGDAAAELALVTQTGWGVWELNGTAVSTQAKPFIAGDTLVAIHDPSPVDRLAFCGRPDVNTSTVYLSVLRPGGQLDPAVALGAYRGVALAAADMRKTGYDDLIANCISEYKVLRLQNWRSDTNPNGADFLPYVAEVDTVEAGGPQPSLCTPLAADLDLDGQLDFACAFEGVSTYTLAKLSSTPRPLGSCAPLPVMGGPFFRQSDFAEETMVHYLVSGICLTPPATTSYGTRLILRVSANAFGLAGTPANLNGKHLEVVLYQQSAVNGVAGQLGDFSTLHVRYTIGTHAQVQLIPLDESHGDLRIEVPLLGDSDTILNNCYYFQVRLLPPDDQQGVYPTFIGSYTGFMSGQGTGPNSNASILTALVGAIYGIDIQPRMISSTCGPLLTDTSQRLGGMAPQTRMPKLPSGYPPQPVAFGPAGTIGVEGALAASVLAQLPLE